MALPVYPIYRALTRPALNRLGIPQWVGYSLAIFAVILVGLIGRNNLFYAIFALPPYLVARGLTEWDPNFFNLINLWRKTSGKSLMSPVARMWGGSMLSALPVGIPSNYEEITGAV